MGSTREGKTVVEVCGIIQTVAIVEALLDLTDRSAILVLPPLDGIANGVVSYGHFHLKPFVATSGLCHRVTTCHIGDDGARPEFP
jgi:hypothetical protein